MTPSNKLVLGDPYYNEDGKLVCLVYNWSVETKEYENLDCPISEVVFKSVGEIEFDFNEKK